MIRNAGFDAYDYSFYWATDAKDMLGDDYTIKANTLRQLADSMGLVCNQAHAPLEIGYADSFDLENENFLRLVRSLEFASILGAKNIVVHAIKNDLPENMDIFAYNTHFFSSLIPWCAQYKIAVCIENLHNWKEICNPTEHQNYVKQINSPWIKICVDVGHSAINGYLPEQVLSAMDSTLLSALHIHDNDYTADLHMLPGEGKFNWNAITAALKQIGYTGDFTLELTGYLRRKEPEELQSALNRAHQVGRTLISRI